MRRFQLRPAAVISAVFFLLIALPARAQKGHPLGKDAQDFSETLPAYMVSDPNLKKEAKDFIAQWVPEYQNYFASLGNATREDIAELARLAHKAHVQPYPELYEFLRTCQIVEQWNPGILPDWMAALTFYLKKSQGRRFNTLVGKTYDLLINRTLYKGNNTASWRMEEDAHFTFKQGDKKRDEPYFDFFRVTLMCSDGADSLTLYRTEGQFYPLSDRFEGNGGRAFWVRVGLHPDSCYTEPQAYTLNLKQARIEASGAVHHNYYIYPLPLKGNFTDRIITGNPLIKERYPQFVSQDVLYFTDLFPGIDLQGTLVQEGLRSSFGSEKEQARMTVRYHDTVAARITSSRFLSESGRINSTDARFVMYLGERDSLYNSTVTVRYENSRDILYVTIPQGTGLKVPFINTYHKIRMEFEAMRWHIAERKVDIGLLEIPGRVGTVSFKSQNLFSRDELGAMTLGTELNPLFRLADLSHSYNDVVLSLDEVAGMLNMSTTQALAMLKSLIAYGYVSYDAARKKVTLLPQLFHALKVTAGRADFDEIEFKSTEEGIVKAVLRLDSLDIRMAKVPYILLSSKQEVYAEPSDSVIYIYRDADFHFDGLFHAGVFNYTARGARFYYKDFKVDIADIKELGLEVSRIEGGEEVRHAVETVIKSMAGTVYIDHPNNKGGRRNFPEYPIFESLQQAYVYFNAPHIQRGAYTADSFYFRVEPFKMEKLRTIEVDSIRFAGALLSFGLFPDIPEELRVRPDYSLGFATYSPKGGWPAYDSKCNYEGELFLDKGGLYGKGEFKYLGLTAQSDYLLFLPKRMTGTSKDMEMDDSRTFARTYPRMTATGVRMDYSRPKSALTLRSGATAMHFYKEDWAFEGTYTLSPASSHGSGSLLNSGQFYLESRNFDLNKRRIEAEDGRFRITSPGADFLRADSVIIRVDLDERSGRFMALDELNGHAPVEFGINRYKGHAAILTWEMDKKEVSMIHGGSGSAALSAAMDTVSISSLFSCALPGENFVSTRRAQAGLNFNATTSLLSYADTSLRFDGVYRLLVADAMFVPARRSLWVGKSGMLASLTEAELYFGNHARPHSFHKVQAQVLSAEQYRASGYFDYKAPGLNTQHIHFTGIRPLSEGYSQAAARITYDSGLLALNEAFQFIGKIELSALETYPFFAGSVRMNYACKVDVGSSGSIFGSRTAKRRHEPEPEPEPEPESDYGEFVYDGIMNETMSGGYDDFEYGAEPERSEKAQKIAEAGVLEAEKRKAAMAEEAERDAQAAAALLGDADDAMERDIEKSVDDDDHDSPVARRGRKKSEDEARPSEEAVGLGAGNPFLTDGIQFRAYINSDSVCIPIDAKTRSTVGRLLGCGFYSPMRSRQIQYLFMERKLSTDIPVLAVEGSLQYSARDKSYKVLDDEGTELFRLSLGTCFASAWGEIEPGFNTYELKTNFFGNIMRGGDGRISVDGMGLYKFYMGTDVQKRLADLLNKNYVGTGDGELSRDLQGYLQRNLPEREKARVMAEANLYGMLHKIPECLDMGIVFSNIEFVWDADKKAFYSYPEAEADVLSVGAHAVNRRFNVLAAMRKTRKGDIVDIYLEQPGSGEIGSGSVWVYFSYTNHYMQVVTSDNALNAYIKGLKAKLRKKGRYEYFLATLSKKNTFVTAMKEIQGL